MTTGFGTLIKYIYSSITTNDVHWPREFNALQLEKTQERNHKNLHYFNTYIVYRGNAEKKSLIKAAVIDILMHGLSVYVTKNYHPTLQFPSNLQSVLPSLTHSFGFMATEVFWFTFTALICVISRRSRQLFSEKKL